ncbi:MAG: CHAP domain-containing protein [Polyangiaceae bacterium]
MSKPINPRPSICGTFIALAILSSGCVNADQLDPHRKLYPDVGEAQQAIASCGSALVTWGGTTAYSNGNDTGTAASCKGGGQFGFDYQCVELVMRHFTTNWGLDWDGDATDLLDNAPSATVDVYLDGDTAHPPVPGDMIVFGGGEMGHVALVTSVSATEIGIIEQNVPSSYQRKLTVSNGKVDAQWDGFWTKGWAHAKANTSAPAGAPPSWSCGTSEHDGQQYWTCQNGDLYRCQDGTPQKTSCYSAGCITRPPGMGDVCSADSVGQPGNPGGQPGNPGAPGGLNIDGNPGVPSVPHVNPGGGQPGNPGGGQPGNPGGNPGSPGGGDSGGSVEWSCGMSSFGGQQLWTCSDGNLYRCDGQTPVEQQCSVGCVDRSLGKDDLCISAAPGWNCAASQYASGQSWTCIGGSLYRCDKGAPEKVDCPNGCVVHPFGQADTCN